MGRRWKLKTTTSQVKVKTFFFPSNHSRQSTKNNKTTTTSTTRTCNMSNKKTTKSPQKLHKDTKSKATKTYKNKNHPKPSLAGILGRRARSENTLTRLANTVLGRREVCEAAKSDMAYDKGRGFWGTLGGVYSFFFFFLNSYIYI